MDFIDLKSRQILIREQVDERIQAVLEHGQFLKIIGMKPHYAVCLLQKSDFNPSGILLKVNPLN